MCAAGKVVPCNYYADGTYKNQKPIKPKPKTTLTREARIDNVENISVVLLVVVAVVDLNRFRSNAQKRLTKDCSGDQIRCAPLGVDGGSTGASRVEWLMCVRWMQSMMARKEPNSPSFDRREEHPNIQDREATGHTSC